MKIRALVLVVTLLTSLNSYATTVFIEGSITRTLATGNSRWGGCMIKPTIDYAAAGLSCSTARVSFSCSGNFNTKEEAIRMNDAAVMAFALGKSVALEVTDDETHNSYCVAKRIEVF